MTNDEIRDVFAELERVGVDLGQPPGLALGTGFREGEFRAWLRTLPDDLGHDAFVERLTQQVNAAQPNAGASLPRGSAAGQPHREFPTVEQVHGAVDVLLREWDPLGARLGEMSREDVVHHAFNALGRVLRGQDPDAIERSISAMLGNVEQEAFGVRPSPRANRRYLARRIIQVVVDHPGPPHEEDAWAEMQRATESSMAIARAEGRVRETRTATSSGVTVCFGPRGDEPPALDPNAACTECGVIGTVAVVGREVEPLYSRYCLACWSTVRDKYWGSFWRKHPKVEDEATPEGMIAALDAGREEMLFQARERTRFAASAMWEDHLPFTEAMVAPNDAISPEVRERELRRAARDLRARASHMYGDMPPAVEAFVRQFAGPDSEPPSSSDQHEQSFTP